MLTRLVPIPVPIRIRHLRNLPNRWWLGTLAIAFSLSYLVGVAVNSAQNYASRFGETVSIPVVTRNISPGEMLQSNDVKVTKWPRVLLPKEDLAFSPVGSRATINLISGEPLLVSRLAPAGQSAVSALLKAGQRSIDVPFERAQPNVEVGDIVDAIGTAPNSGSKRVALNARVVATSQSATTIAVNQYELDEIAEALSNGPVILSVVSLESIEEN